MTYCAQLTLRISFGRANGMLNHVLSLLNRAIETSVCALRLEEISCYLHNQRYETYASLHNRIVSAILDNAKFYYNICPCTLLREEASLWVV